MEPWEKRIIASTASPIVIRKVIASLLDVRIVVGCWMLAMDQHRVMKIRGSIWILIFHGLSVTIQWHDSHHDLRFIWVERDMEQMILPRGSG